MAYNIYLSSSPFSPVLIVSNWFLVFQFLVLRVYLTIAEAVILILRHATILQLSTSEESALTQSELDYQQADIDLNIQHLMASSSEHSIKEFVTFIMATDIGSFILASVPIVSY